MKFLVLITATVAVAAVSAQIATTPNDPQATWFYDTEVCENGNGWIAIGDKCDSELPDPWNTCHQYDNAYFKPYGVCCGDGGQQTAEEIAFCEKVESKGGCTIDTNQNCGRCYFQEIPIVKKVARACCAHPHPLGELFGLDNKYCIKSLEALEQWKAWTTLVTQDRDVFIAADVGYCGHSTVMIQLNASEEVRNYTCFTLCCDCCHNIQVTTVNAARDYELEHEENRGAAVAVDPQNNPPLQWVGSLFGHPAVVKQYYDPEQVNNNFGPAAICYAEDGPLVLKSADGAILASDLLSSSYHRVAVSCQKKTDGFCCSGKSNFNKHNKTDYDYYGGYGGFYNYYGYGPYYGYGGYGYGSYGYNGYGAYW